MTFREDTIEKLKDHITSFPKLNEEDKKLWFSRIEALPHEFAVLLINFFEESPEEITKINNNFKEKERIAETGDSSAWSELLKKEEEELLSYAEKT